MDASTPASSCGGLGESATGGTDEGAANGTGEAVGGGTGNANGEEGPIAASGDGPGSVIYVGLATGAVGGGSGVAGGGSGAADGGSGTLAGGDGSAAGGDGSAAGDDGSAAGRGVLSMTVMTVIVVMGRPPVTVTRVVVVSAGTGGALIEFIPLVPSPKRLCASCESLQPMETPATLGIGKARHFWSLGHASSWNAPELQRAIWPSIQATCVPEQADWDVRPEFRSLRLLAWARFTWYTLSATEAVPTG